MTESTNPPLPRKRSWPRRLAWIAGTFLVLLIVGYFVVTSGPFFKAVILPKVGKSLDSDVTVSSASISPFSAVVLHDLAVHPRGAEPLLTAGKVTARYSLMDIIKGNIVVQEASLENLVVTIIENPDGTTNLDPILEATSKSDSADEPADQDPAKPSQVRVEKMAINNGTIRIQKKYAGDKRDSTEVTGLNLLVTNLRNGESGKAVLAANLSIDNQPPALGTNAPVDAKLEGTIAGNFEFKLSPALQPETLSGQTKVDVSTASGSMAQFARIGADLICEVTPTEVKNVSLRLRREATPLGEILVTGPFDVSKTEGELMVVLSGVDRQTLNLFAGADGLDFGATTVTATNLIKMAQGGAVVETTGHLNLNRFSVKQENQTSPAVDLQLRFQTKVDRTAQKAELQAFTVEGRQNGQPLIHGGLTRPMSISLDGNSNAIGDSALQLSITNLNLAEWQHLASQTNLAGLFGMDLTLLAQQAGQGLTLSLKSSITGLKADLGSNQISHVDVKLGLNSQVTALDRVTLERCQLEVVHEQTRAVAATVTGVYQLGTKAADLEINVENNLPALLKMLPQPGLSARTGNVLLQGHVLQTNDSTTFQGDLHLREFTGALGTSHFTNYLTKLTMDVTASDALVDIRGFTVGITNGGAAGGSLTLAGKYDQLKTNFTGSLKFDSVNQHALEPFLSGALGDTRLIAISLNGTATTHYTAQGPMGVDAAISVTNLVVQEPNKPGPNPPLAVQLRADVAQTKDILDLRRISVGLSPTARATNELVVTGRLDLSDTNATQGNIKIVAESLDVTPYYDLFAGQPSDVTNAPPGQATSPSTNQPAPATEPPAQSLPLRNFEVELAVGALYLREIEIKQWQVKTRIDGSNVNVEPFKLALNGAPINLGAKVNLGVPGYQYDLSFDVAKMPLGPLVDTFTPENRGMYQGDLITSGRIRGLGTTGPNLRQHLDAQLGWSFTNATLQILSPKLKRILTPIATLLTVPDLMRSPITFVNLTAAAGQGKVEIKQLTLASAAFLAETTGQIPLADDVLQSPLNGWPVAFSLRRSMAESIRAISKETNHTSDYVRLPDFIKVTGTIGEPNAKLDKLALTGSVLEKYADKIPGLDEKTGNMLKGLGGLIGNKRETSTTNNPSSTNAPSTNQPAPPKFNPLDLLKKPQK